MILLGPPRAIVLAGAWALLLLMPCGAQTLRKSPLPCAPSCPPRDQTTEVSEANPHRKIIIDDVIFDGPAPPPDSRTAQRVIEEIKQHQWDATHWLDEILEVSVRAAWQENGYFKAVSSGKSEIVFEDPEGQHVVLTIHVDAGLQYWLGNVSFRNSDPDQGLVFSVGELRPLLSLQEGDVFNVTKIRDSLDAIHRRYIEYGYFNFVATPVTEVNDSKQRISLIFELDQGKQFRISKVEVRGSVPGSEAKLISKLHPGDIFKPSVVEDSVRAIAPGLSDEELKKALSLRKNEKTGTVAIIVDFRQHPPIDQAGSCENDCESDEP